MTQRQLRFVDAAYAAYLWSLVALALLAWWYALYRAGALDTRPYSTQGVLFFVATASGLVAAFIASLIGCTLFIASLVGGTLHFRGTGQWGLFVLAIFFCYGMTPAIVLRHFWGARPLIVAGGAFAVLIVWYGGRWFFVERRRAAAEARRAAP
jgi:hypothetical protein